MTDRPDGRRDSSGDARAIPQRPRPASATSPLHRRRAVRPPTPEPSADATRVMPVAGGPDVPRYVDSPWVDPRHDAGAYDTREFDTRADQGRGYDARGYEEWDEPPPGPPPPPARGARMGTPRRRRHTGRKIVAGVLVLAVAWICATIWAVNGVWSSVGRVDATPAPGHIDDTAGRNILMVGSDGRTDLSPEERNRLGTGFTEGARTDSIMVLHTGGGDPTLLSIPRDSYVEIPGHGMNKINAAFALGGPKLLSETIEKATGLRIDGYLEIGFGGFANLVDAVGGVRMCLPNAMKDEKAHIDLPAGCQLLDGKNALGYVRARYSDPEGDLGRVKRQRAFLGALMGKLSTKSNVLLPWKLHSVGTAGASAITIGEDDGMIGTGRAFLGMRALASGTGNSVTVPVSNNALNTPAGQAVEWDAAKSAALFTALREDEPLSVPPGS